MTDKVSSQITQEFWDADRAWHGALVVARVGRAPAHLHPRFSLASAMGERLAMSTRTTGNDMVDLDAAAIEYNAAFTSTKAPLMARAGKRSVKYFKLYEGSSRKSGYGIGRGEAARIAAAYGVTIT